VIVFGVAVGDGQKFREWAEPGIRRAAESDSVVFVSLDGSIQRGYNAILDQAAAIEDLEAVVLLHQDLEIRDARLLSRIRDAFADQRVAVLGQVGGTETRSIAWWDGTRYGRVASPDQPDDANPRYDVNQPFNVMKFTDFPYGWHEVEAVDGMLLVLSPWAAREVRFDERFTPYFHGYDIDYCFQVRARGRRCLIGPLDCIHHTGPWSEHHGDWVQAELMWQRKWGARGARPAALAWA
jgi:hypothetical protein